MWQKHSPEILNCNRQSYGEASATWISIHWFWNQSVPFSFWKLLHEKHFFGLFGAHWKGGPVGSTKCLCKRVFLQNAVCMTKVIQQNVITKWWWVKSHKRCAGPHAISCCDPEFPAKADHRVPCRTESIPPWITTKCSSDFSELSSNSEQPLHEAARDGWLQHLRHDFMSEVNLPNTWSPLS